MKKFTFLITLVAAFSFAKSQGLEAVVVEKYYSSNAADSINADNNGAITPLHVGSITYRVFIDMAPGYKYIQLFGNQDASANVLHPLVIKTTTNFYNDPNNGQVFPQGNTVINTKKNTTLIDSWLSVGGVCSGKMGVLKTEDTDGSIGNSNNVLTNNPGGVFGVAINSVVVGAQDGLMPGTAVAPNALGLGAATDVFDQSAGGTFSTTNGAIAALGGNIGVTPSNMILIGQFTTNGVLSFSLNIQISNTVTNVAEIYVPNNVQQGEFLFPGLMYTSSTNTNTGVGIETSGNEFESASISIFPNPAHGFFTINGYNVKENTSGFYSIVDISGRPIVTKNISKLTQNFTEIVDLTNFKDGLYFVSVNIDGIVTTQKIIKE
jgi:hypothetical protein